MDYLLWVQRKSLLVCLLARESALAQRKSCVLGGIPRACSTLPFRLGALLLCRFACSGQSPHHCDQELSDTKAIIDNRPTQGLQDCTTSAQGVSDIHDRHAQAASSLTS